MEDGCGKRGKQNARVRSSLPVSTLHTIQYNAVVPRHDDMT